MNKQILHIRVALLSQARGGLEALASATTQRGFAPRDGSGGLSGGTPAVEAGAAGGVGGVRIAAGPPAPEAGGGGGWRERERAASIDKRKVCVCVCCAVLCCVFESEELGPNAPSPRGVMAQRCWVLVAGARDRMHPFPCFEPSPLASACLFRPQATLPPRPIIL